MIASCEHSPLSFRQLADTKAYFLFKDILIPNLPSLTPRMSGSWGRGGDTKPSLTLTPFGQALGWGQPGVPRDKKGGKRQMQVGVGRPWWGYLCLCMSNNEQPQRSANYFALHQHESKRKHRLQYGPSFSLGLFTLQWERSTSSPCIRAASIRAD